MQIVNVRTEQIIGRTRMETYSQMVISCRFVSAEDGDFLGSRKGPQLSEWAGYLVMYRLAVDGATCENTVFGGPWSHCQGSITSSRSVTCFSS